MKISREELEKKEFTGIVRGKYIDSEWLNGDSMKGYGIYFVSNGTIELYGCFSETGKLEDTKFARLLCDSWKENEGFEIIHAGECPKIYERY